MTALADLLSPEYIAIIVVAVLILAAVFFAVVANKISGVDAKIAELTENVQRKLEVNVGNLSDRLHNDFLERSAEQERSLAQMGDTWRSTLDKTVSDVQSEIGKLKGEVEQNNSSLNKSLIEIITENSVNFNEQLAFVRDTHAQTMQEYHQQLANQVREHAAGEREILTGVLDGITKSVNTNLTALAENQKSALGNVAEGVSSGYTTLADKVDKEISQTTSSAKKSLANMVKSLDDNVSAASTKLNTDLGSIGKKVDAELNQVKGKLNSTISTINSDLTSNVSSISQRLEADIEAVATKLDSSVTTVEEKVDTGMQKTSAHVSGEMRKLAKNLDKNIDELSDSVDANFDKVGAKLNKQVKDNLQNLIEVFKGFAAKVEAIEDTNQQIKNLSDNVNILSQVLDDRRSRGTVGEVLVESIVKDTLAPADYKLNATLSNDYKADCLLKLPKPSGNVAINANLDISDLEVIATPSAGENEIAAARASFASKFAAAIEVTATSCIIAGETADGAVLLLPSESAFTEAHTHHRPLVDEAYRKSVWIASPSTLIAMVTIARTVIKDATARREMQQLYKQFVTIERDYASLETNFQKMTRSVDDMLTHATKTRKDARKLGDRLNKLNSIFDNSTELNIEEGSPAKLEE